MELKLLPQKPFSPYSALKGVGQIMLQENALTGLLFLSGIFSAVPGTGLNLMGIGAIVAVCCGTITAWLPGYDKEEINKGLYGFSAALVGVALLFYFQPVFVTWVAIIVGSAIATILQHWFIDKKIPVFTLPFVLVTWAIIYLFHNWYPVSPAGPITGKTYPDSGFAFSLKGFARVIFQGSAVAGLIFFIAVFINSPIAALYGIAGSVLAAVLATQFAVPVEGIALGLFSYNAVLCAIVFAGNTTESGLWALIAVVLSMLINLIMVRCSFTVLTFPFVAATCIALVFKKHASVVIHKYTSGNL